ncbi:FadR/GntR family transcriptional regulator [Bordetella holmesii]|uniref:FCD domain protein n=2 Tax=Bordetella holmesii TaxID=35814 RepID=A0A158M748_9BORD|nr:FadR/GntR family transcriptional regulator [Bordetella holmesii]AHV92689.1 bacterial regulatory s, gntR family protein [Bordetella holmesii ATCC 51541]AIT25148.1 bacterial regulatory s, gntR family protein [Bordetella holmesii 44057]EWM45714.1 bacterial regulatory s, gntR family protein [Bordetella holmesii 70147]EWM48539.1 bacterial regulatory s, gntR family protein [Bordetella holmesii 41130]EWM49835.1 bacterial regulatory s, gntR family protein [Bordetella holmesii 35009]
MTVLYDSQAVLRRPRNLAQGLVESFTERIRAGAIAPGQKLPTESEIMRQFGVSRTVVREALSRLQASGLVVTHHGVGTYALQPAGGTDFRVDPADLGAVRGVLVLLELRVCVETEAAGLAALRRTPEQLAAMRRTLDTFQSRMREQGDTITPDFEFHLLVAQATGNRYFADLMSHLGSAVIPHTRINSARLASEDDEPYLVRVNFEHETIYGAIRRQDAEAARAAMRTHLSNSRERLRGMDASR